MVVGGVDHVDNSHRCRSGRGRACGRDVGDREVPPWRAVDAPGAGHTPCTARCTLCTSRCLVVHTRPQVCVGMSASLHTRVVDDCAESVHDGPQSCPQSVDICAGPRLRHARGGLGRAVHTGVDTAVDKCGRRRRDSGDVDGRRRHGRAREPIRAVASTTSRSRVDGIRHSAWNYRQRGEGRQCDCWRMRLVSSVTWL